MGGAQASAWVQASALWLLRHKVRPCQIHHRKQSPYKYHDNIFQIFLFDILAVGAHFRTAEDQYIRYAARVNIDCFMIIDLTPMKTMAKTGAVRLGNDKLSTRPASGGGTLAYAGFSPVHHNAYIMPRLHHTKRGTGVNVL